LLRKGGPASPPSIQVKFPALFLQRTAGTRTGQPQE